MVTSAEAQAQLDPWALRSTTETHATLRPFVGSLLLEGVCVIAL